MPTSRWLPAMLLIGCAHRSQSVSLSVPLLSAPVPVEGRTFLTHELHVLGSSTTATQVEIIDGATSRVLHTLAGEELGRVTAALGASAQVVYLDLPLDAPIASIFHRLQYSIGDRSEIAEGATLALPADRPIVLGPPLAGGPWVAVYSPDWPRGHRRVFYTIGGVARLPGRFAIDWVRVDESGAASRGDPDLVADSLGYAAEVLAVADATVVAARDDMRESERIADHPKHAPADAAGNHVALDLGGGRIVFYEHLKPGSIEVQVGQRVSRGQIIAALGFTGDSTGPHLHMHVADANSTLGAEGLPFLLDAFTLLGHYRDISKLGNAPWDALAAGLDPVRTNERPAANAVIRF